MGRFDSAYCNLNGNGNPAYLTPLDFYKYKPGTKTLDPTDSASAFSVDGGTTQNGFRFNANSDTSDSDSQAADSFNSSFGAQAQSMSQTDLVEMQALGWSCCGGINGCLNRRS